MSETEISIEKLGRFDHHPDPAIDFEVEVEELIAMAINRRTGFDPEPDLERRVERAMQFRVGGVPSCVAAKADLRKIDAELRSKAATEPKFTPGPWEFVNGFVMAGGDALKVVGIQMPMVSGPARLEAIVNARLIAAAPDLLRVAELLVSWLDEEEGAHKLCDAARAAIAKATVSP